MTAAAKSWKNKDPLKDPATRADRRQQLDNALRGGMSRTLASSKFLATATEIKQAVRRLREQGVIVP
jgi:transposase